MLNSKEAVIGTTLPHSSFGDPECRGCLNARVDGYYADIVCEKCKTVIATVAADNLQRTFDDMELSIDLCSSICERCGAVNLVPGHFKIRSITCAECGNVTGPVVN